MHNNKRKIVGLLFCSIILLSGCGNNVNNTKDSEDNSENSVENTNNINNRVVEDSITLVDEAETNYLTKQIDKKLVGIYKDNTSSEYFQISENGEITLKVEPGDGAPITYNTEDIDVYFYYIKNNDSDLEWKNVVVRFDVRHNDINYSYVYYGGYINNNYKTILSFTDGRNTPVGTGETYRFIKSE